jgi:hypothetical protein
MTTTGISEEQGFFLNCFNVQEWSAITNYLCTLFHRVESNLEEMALIDTDKRLLRKILEI